MKNMQYFVPKLINVILLVGLLAFEAFNVITTADALKAIVPLGVGTILAIAFCATDIAGLVRVMTPAKTMQEEPKVVKALFGVWFSVAIINAFLTWFSLQSYFDVTAIKVPVVMNNVKFIIPVILSIVIFMIHFVIVYSLGVFLERSEAFRTNPTGAYRPSQDRKAVLQSMQAQQAHNRPMQVGRETSAPSRPSSGSPLRLSSDRTPLSEPMPQSMFRTSEE